MNTLNPYKRILAVDMLRAGHSIRSVERETGIHRDTVMRLAHTITEVHARIERQAAAIEGRRQEREAKTLYRSLDRRANAEAAAIYNARLRHTQSLRQAKVATEIEADKKAADTWMLEHFDLFEDPTNRLFFMWPLNESNKSEDDWRANTLDRATFNHLASVFGGLSLEDAIIEKIDRERAGEYVEVSCSGIGYLVHHMEEFKFGHSEIVHEENS